MEIIKRDGSVQIYERIKIEKAICAAAKSLNQELADESLKNIVDEVESRVSALMNVELIQDLVEEELMRQGHYAIAKAYILYREEHSRMREIVGELLEMLKDKQLLPIFQKVVRLYPQKCYHLSLLHQKMCSFYKPEMSADEALIMLMKACNELIQKDAVKWEMIASLFLNYYIEKQVSCQEKELGLDDGVIKFHYLVDSGYMGSYIIESYRDEEIAELLSYIKEDRNDLFTYSGLELVMKRYLIHTHDHRLLERPQEMFMGIAMHLAMLEKDRVAWAKQFYDVLSKLEVTMATPTMSNARKPYHQMSSCFIDTVADSLTGIYKSLDNFAQVSKFGGGMGLYFGKVRANGSDIRGFEGAAGGVIRWIKLVNNTAVAVDQLGVRQGAVAVYLDAWHKDLPEFLQLKTNNGDDRMKAHDVFPAICYPDLFWRWAKESLDHTWYMMCPHEILKVKGYALEDFYGAEWEQRYVECIEDKRISKRTMVLRDVVRLILKSAVETGTPFAFNRDIVNRMNPNPHQGMIYCSNLCSEIAQNMSAMECLESEIVEIGGEKIVVEKSKPGDFVVCNLASLVLGNIDLNDREGLKKLISATVRALDNVIDLNYYPLPYAQITNHQMRPIGLGTSGYHHALVKNGLSFESHEHLQFVDELYEFINYSAIQASCELAEEKGSYTYFSGSDWDNGEYFKKRGYEDEKWQALAQKVHECGLRNGYLMAIAPTSSTSIIAGSSASIDPIMNKVFMEEKKGSMITRVAPDLSPMTFWLYKNAHQIDQRWVVDAAGIRQRHIDQSQSLNLYITNEFTLKQVLNLYIQAWESGVKTVYYVRSKSLEIEECESCSA